MQSFLSSLTTNLHLILLAKVSGSQSISNEATFVVFFKLWLVQIISRLVYMIMV